MEEYIKGIKVAIASTVGLLTGLWGWFGWLVLLWIFCMVVDYATGTIAAGMHREWKSGRAFEGIAKKGGMIVIVLVAASADLLLSIVLSNLPILDIPMEYSGLICPIVLVWYIITELGSITENAVSLGSPVPKMLVRLLAAAKETVESTGEHLLDDADKDKDADKNEGKNEENQ